MKLFFNFFFILFFFSHPLFSKDLYAEYQIKTRGITIGNLVWELEITEDYYKTFVKLNDKGVLSGFYKFKGQYSALGKIQNTILMPMEYNQSWETKKKKREVKIIFTDQKISELYLNPKEKELPRFEFNNLKEYSDPITSFINILTNNTPSYTIDGRRAYLLFPKEINNHNKILIKKYINIWADHKRNDLEYIEFYKDTESILPQKIKIKFKGSVFSLNKT